MMDSLLTFLQQNQLFAGIMGAALTGGLMWALRAAPVALLRMAGTWFTVSVEVISEDPAHRWMLQWLSGVARTEKARRLSVLTDWGVDGHFSPGDPQGSTKLRLRLSLAPGMHLFFYRGFPVWLTRTRHEDKIGAVRETLNVRVLTASRRIVDEMLEGMRRIALRREEGSIAVYANGSDSWYSTGTRAVRPLSTLALPEGLSDSLLQDMNAYLTGQAWYAQRGVPWRRGYLFYGPPGTGKTSTTVALAATLGADVYVLSLASVYSDNSLRHLCRNLPAGAMLVLEDIDAAFRERQTSSENTRDGITFSGLLNVLDGAVAGEGRILVMTTNHIDKLDPALIRDGRIDRQEKFGYALPTQAAQMFSLFFPGDPRAEQFGAMFANRETTPAEIQGLLLRNRDDASAAIRASTRPDDKP